MFYLTSKAEHDNRTCMTSENGDYCQSIVNPCSSTDLSSSSTNNIPQSVMRTFRSEYYENEHQTMPGSRCFSSTHQRRIGFKQRASQIILQVPAEHLRRIKETEGIGSIRRETQHFSQTTTMHGPKRIYQGKRFSTHFWILMVLTSGVLLVHQVGTLLSMYVSNPIVSQVSFLISEKGMHFPMVTLCNFNPIKKSYIQKLNTTGDFSYHLLGYLMESLMDTQTLYGNADRAELHVGDRALQVYQEQHPNFTIDGFFYEAGFDCTEVMKLCSFGGRQFDCCKFMEPIITNLGKCHSLDMRKAREWMRKQTVAGVNAGLQIILDAHMEEQFDGTGDNSHPIFSNAFENGYRYYVHAPDTIPYLVSEGMSVSPGTRVYSAISTNTYVLLSSENWGNCSDKWPSSYNTTLPYSSVNCGSLCKANYFYDRCGCSPFTYNIDMSFPMCTPYQTFQCIDQYIRRNINGTDYFYIPQCQDCKIECHSLVYHAYNSYGKGFSHGALKWLNRKNSSWSNAHMRSNFLTVNVFFRDMAHTEYRQVQATSLTEILNTCNVSGDIGGNMGMFLGMSLITVTEVSLFISKIGWIAFSKRRRDYLYNKKKSEKEREKQLEETVSGFNMFRIKKVADVRDSFRVTQSRLRAFGKKLRDSFRVSKPKGLNAPPLYSSNNEKRSNQENHEDVLKNHHINCGEDPIYKSSLNSGGTLRKQESMIELQIDLRGLRRKMLCGLPINIRSRRRASTAPPTPRSINGDPQWSTSQNIATLCSFEPVDVENQ